MTRDELVRSLCTPLPDVVRQRKESGDLAGAPGIAARRNGTGSTLAIWIRPGSWPTGFSRRS